MYLSHKAWSPFVWKFPDATGRSARRCHAPGAAPEPGRLGAGLGDPDSSNEVRLLYLDDDSQSQWVDAATLHPAASSTGAK